MLARTMRAARTAPLRSSAALRSARSDVRRGFVGYIGLDLYGVPEKHRELPIVPRLNSGRVAAKLFRREGYIPAVMYGKEEDGSHSIERLAIPRDVFAERFDYLGPCISTYVFQARLPDSETAVPVIVKDYTVHPGGCACSRARARRRSG